jgi:hypothetical protein
MQRIDGPTRAAALPAPAATGSGSSSPGYFAHGNLHDGVPYTLLDPDWLNMVQEELVAVVVAGGLALNKANHGQVLAALQALFVPAFTHSGSDWRRVGPDGFIECGGVQALGTTSEGTITIDFPVDFPNECLGVLGVMVATGSASGDTQLQEGTLSAGSATMRIQSDGASFSDTTSVRWRAWGR